ncbi:Gfo/Idh/MocA family protein [Terrimonas rubra]|uniref:Gfo/Idh/MocA family protein n=1 Tax=Terrimonas rubra TaxID=1035890 RepID=A0ABW6A3S1_9BACT
MKVLIIGLGSIAQKHIQAIKNIRPDSEIYALRSTINAAVISDVTNIYNADEIANRKFDFIVISNPTALHYQTISGLLQYNIPLFIEKPIFDKLQADELIEAIKQNNIPTYVACNLRFLECLIFTKLFLEGKRINEVNIYCGSYLPDWRPGTNFRESYSANKELGGGAHIDLIHEIDYAYWLFGHPSQIKKTFRSVSSLTINATDYANYLLAYDQFTANVILNYYRKDSKRELEIVFEEGTCLVNLLNNTVTWNEEIVFESAQKIAHTYTLQMKYFIEGITNNNLSLNTAAEAYQVLKICLEEE